MLLALLANLGVGLSYGWWVDKHNRHHAHPNQEDKDPDIEAGALAFSARGASDWGPVARRLYRYQAYLFFPLLLLEAANLHVASVRALTRRAARHRYQRRIDWSHRPACSAGPSHHRPRSERRGSARDFYDGIRLAMHRRVREVIEKQGLARSQIVFLDALLKLRQACCDPRLVAGSDAQSIPSAKLEWLSNVLPELVAEGRRILLFSQFTSMLRLIAAAVGELDIPYLMLTGETQRRAALVEQFQAGGIPLFLISLKAGGTGLNLTAADIVIHYDPWWNPAAEAQATDRAHRIGQQQPVFVYKLIAQGTVEEKIVQLQATKDALARQLFTDKNASPARLTAADLEVLLAP